MTRHFLSHCACNHITQGRCQLAACIADHTVGGTGEQGRQCLAQTVLEHEVNLALQVGEHALDQLFLGRLGDHGRGHRMCDRVRIGRCGRRMNRV